MADEFSRPRRTPARTKTDSIPVGKPDEKRPDTQSGELQMPAPTASPSPTAPSTVDPRKL